MNAVLIAMVLTAAQPVLEPDPGGLKRIQPRNVLASSYLSNGWNQFDENYLPMYAVDDDPATAWVEGADGDGQGETLTWIGPNLKKARGLRIFIRSGYQKSQKLYDANVRPHEISIQPIVNSEAGPVATGTKKMVSLDDVLGWQRIDLPTPSLVSGFTLRIESTYRGTRYEDLCISDIRVYVDGDDKYNEAAEAAAADQIRTFVADRKKAAKAGRGAVVELAPRYNPRLLGTIQDLKTGDAKLAAYVTKAKAVIFKTAPFKYESWSRYDVAHVGAGSWGRAAALSQAHDPGLANLLRFLSQRELAVYGKQTRLDLIDGEHVEQVFLQGEQAAPSLIVFDSVSVQGGDRDAVVTTESQLITFEDGLAAALATKVNHCDFENYCEGQVYFLEWDRSGKTPRLKALVQVKVGYDKSTITRFESA